MKYRNEIRLYLLRLIELENKKIKNKVNIKSGTDPDHNFFEKLSK